jgi:hypothetical protein
MAEEQEESTGKSFKGILITVVSTISLGIAAYVTKIITGEKDETPVQQSAPVININQAAPQQVSGGTKTIIINKGGDGNAKPAPAPKPKKKEGDEFKEEAPKW